MKYKLTKNTKKHWSTTLYQIEAIKDFGRVGKWSLWWWIEKESNLSQDWDAWVSWNARVFWDACVYWDAWVFWNASVSLNACVYWDARVSLNACVHWNARVSWNACVSWSACVYWNACVSWNAWVSLNAMVSWRARVFWNACVSWNARVCGNYNYTKWKFIWWDDSCKIFRIEHKMWSDDWWKAQYVLWDFEITPKEEEIEETDVIMIRDWKKYKVQILEEIEE